MNKKFKGCGNIIKDISRFTERRCGQEGDIKGVFYACKKCRNDAPVEKAE